MTRRGSSYVFGNIFQPPRCVLFDESGLVIGVSGDGMEAIQQGMTVGVVLELVGEPTRRMPAATQTLHYSEPGGEGLFRARLVVLGGDGRVSGVIGYQFDD